MATDVIMPQMGESIAEGTVTKWLKKVGDRVERDEPLFEISTDKVDAEIPSPAAGVLTNILVKENQTVTVSTVVAVIDGEGAATGAPSTPAGITEPAVLSEPATPAPVESAAPVSRAQGKIRSSPLVRRIARDNGVDLAGLQGTGLGGRIS